MSTVGGVTPRAWSPMASLGGMDNETTTITKAGAEDLIATVWYSLGFKPRESLVLAGLRGPRHRIGVILRTDLPDQYVSRARLGALVREVMLPITESGAGAVVAIVSSEAALGAPPAPLVLALRKETAAARVTLFDVLGVTATAYRSLLCHDHHCCPPTGRSLEAVLSSRSAAAHVLNGNSVAESADDLLRDVLPVRGAGPEPGPRGPGEGAEVPVRLTVEQRWRWWELWLEAERHGREDPGPATGEVPGLSRALHDPYLRDAVLFHLLGAPIPELSDLLDGRFAGSPLSAAQLALLPDLAGLLAQRPDPRRLEPGEGVLAGAVRVAAAGDQAPALAMLALLAWFQGRGARARLLLERSEQDSPDVSLTWLVNDLLFGRVRPPWAGTAPEG